MGYLKVILAPVLLPCPMSNLKQLLMMGPVSPVRGMQVCQVEGKQLGTQAYGRRHMEVFLMHLGGIAGENALARGEMISRA